MAEPPFIPRSMWHSRTNWSGVPKMARNVDKVFFHHSVTDPTGDTDAVYEATDDPCADARKIEAIGIQRFGRMSYSYLIHPAGVILEGAGDYVGAHTGGYNSTSFGLCFIGNNLKDWPNEQPTPVAIQAAVWMVDTLQAFGLLKHNAQGLPHNAVKQTACPGLTDNQMLWIRNAAGLRR